MNTKKILKKFSLFFTNLLRHMQLEETKLLPRFEAYTGLDSTMGPTIAIKKEHEKIRFLATKLQKACEQESLEEIYFISSHLHNALEGHSKRENVIPYPLFDLFITPTEWKKIVESLYGDTKSIMTF